MPRSNTPFRSNRFRLSLYVVAIVLVIAVVAQFRKGSSGRSGQEERWTERGRATGPRAVFGEGRPAELPGEPSPAASTPLAPKEDDGGIPNDLPRDIRQLLEQWRASLLRGDLRAHVALYAPRVERFYREKDISREGVLWEKTRMLRKYPRWVRYDIRNVKVDVVSGTRALVTFRKDWEAAGARRFAGSELQRLTLSRVSGPWQIAAEEELKVFWVRR